MENSNVNKNNSSEHMKRALGLPECVAITAGSVIGVGLFTVGSAQVGIMGSSIIIAAIIAFLLVLWPAALYGEMGAALPFAGGTYAYAKRAINYPTAVFTAWNYTIAQIGIAGGTALAFSGYFKWFLASLGINYMADDRIIALILVVVFVLLNYRGIEDTGKVQTGLMYFFWSASLIWFAVVLKDVNFSNFIPLVQGIPTEFSVFAKVILMVWWCFAGFETLVGMGAEVKFPHLNIPRSLTITPLIVFAVNALFLWFLTGLTPLANQPELATALAPYAESMKMAGIVGIPLILLCVGITFGGILGTMNPCTVGPSRYMFIMAEDGCFPKIFAKLHPKYKIPYVGVITVGIISSILILTGSITLIATMCAFSQMICYIVGFVSYLMLKKNEPGLRREYKAPFGTFGAYFSIVTYLGLMVLAVDKSALPYNLGLCVLSLLYYFLFVRKKSMPKEAISEAEFELHFEYPTAEEKIALDRQYKIWKTGAIIAFLISIAVYVVGFVLR